MEINVLERIYTMKITPIQKVNFTAYSPKDINNLKNYTLKHKQGALCDLYKKFDVALIDTFKMTNRIEVPKFTQNWKVGERAESQIVHKVSTARPKGGFYSKVGR